MVSQAEPGILETREGFRLAIASYEFLLNDLILELYGMLIRSYYQ